MLGVVRSKITGIVALAMQEEITPILRQIARIISGLMDKGSSLTDLYINLNSSNTLLQVVNHQVITVVHHLGMHHVHHSQAHQQVAIRLHQLQVVQTYQVTTVVLADIDSSRR